MEQSEYSSQDQDYLNADDNEDQELQDSQSEDEEQQLMDLRDQYNGQNFNQESQNEDGNNFSQADKEFEYQSNNEFTVNKSDINKSQNYEPRKWQWATPLIEGVPPSPRGGHTATLWEVSIVVFGVQTFKYRAIIMRANKKVTSISMTPIYSMSIPIDGVQEYIYAKRNKISGTPPAPRYAHTAILAGSRIIIFGGKGEKTVFRDLHALDPQTLTWYQGPEGSGSPSARYGHSCTLVNGINLFLFGGWNGIDFFNDLYVLNLEVMAWTKPACIGPSPCPRQGHVAIQVGNNMIIQGGFFFDEQAQQQAGFNQGSQLRSCYFNDLRILDTETFVWSRLRVSGTPPQPRYSHTANISGPDIVYFGGWTLISGDRGEQNFIPQQDIDYFLVLNTELMSWEKGNFVGTPPLNRYGHTATSIGPHLLLFGGWEYSRATNEVVVLRDLNVGKKA